MGVPQLQAQVVQRGGRDVLLSAVPFGLRNIGELHIAMEGEWLGHPQGAFKFDRDTFAAMVDRFEAQANPLPIDYEHNSFPEPGMPADTRAAGWIQRLEQRDGKSGAELWAVVEWTDAAAKMIRSGEYKFCSPAFALESTDRKTADDVGPELKNVALTNLPFLDGQTPIKLSFVAANKAANTKRASDVSVSIGNFGWVPNAGTPVLIKQPHDPSHQKGSIDSVSTDVAIAVKLEDGTVHRWYTMAELEIDQASATQGLPTVMPMSNQGRRPINLKDPATMAEESETAPAMSAEEMAMSQMLTAMIDALAEALGVDRAAAVAALDENTDAIAGLLRQRLDSDGMPQEEPTEMADEPKEEPKTASDNPEKRAEDIEARALANDVKILASRVAELTAEQKKLKAKQDAEDTQRKADKSAADTKRVDDMIACGALLDTEKEDALWMLSQDVTRFERMYGNRQGKDKPVPIGVKQASDELVDPEKATTADLTEDEKGTYRWLLRQKWSPEKAVKKVIEYRNKRSANSGAAKVG